MLKKGTGQIETNVKRQPLDMEKAQDEARKYLRMKRAEADEQATTILRKATAVANDEADRIKANALVEANQMKKDVAVLRATLKEELETQRLLTKVAEIQAESSDSFEQRNTP
jgi:hypothetical protein